MNKLANIAVGAFIIGLPTLFVLTLVLSVCGLDLPWTRSF